MYGIVYYLISSIICFHNHRLFGVYPEILISVNNLLTVVN